MARLQDFNTVTPTNSDNILIVQSTGQGLASVGSTLGVKMDKANPRGTGSFAIGGGTITASGAYSFATGYNTTASNDEAHAEGSGTTASGQYGSHAEGLRSEASGSYSHAEGYSTQAVGSASHAEGYSTITNAVNSHVEGNSNTINILEGQASNGCHAEGMQNTISGNAAHAEGRGNTVTNANYAHVEGYQNTITGVGGHVEGYGNTASGQFSHCEGQGTKTTHRSQHVFGEYNVADTSTATFDSRGTYIEIVGKGSNNANRSNARTLDWSGNETIAGTLTQSSDARLKEVKNDDIPDVSSIKAVRFTWKKGIGRDFDEHIGYLAQDVEKALPFLVKEDAEGNKVLDYIAFLVAKVDSLEKRISELEKGE